MVKTICMMLAAAVTLASCGAPARTMSARGFEADIRLRSGTIADAELLSLQDGVLMAAADGLRIVSEQEIESIYLHIDQNRTGWIAMVAIFQVIPSFALMGRFADEGGIPAGIGGLGVAGLTTWAYIGAEPKQTYRWPLSAAEMEELRLRMRYPYGISPTQIEQLRMSMPATHTGLAPSGAMTVDSMIPVPIPGGWQTMVLIDSSNVTVTILEVDSTRYTVRERSGSLHTIPKNAVVRYGPVGTVAVPAMKEP